MPRYLVSMIFKHGVIWLIMGVLAMVWRILAAIGGWVRRWWERRRPGYERAGDLLSPGEMAFLRALRAACSPRYCVFTKVRLADIVTPRRGLSGSRQVTLLNRVACKHVDFVLCEEPGYAVAAVVELDDVSHERPDRRERDALVDRALAEAAVPLLRVKARRNYAAGDIAAQLNGIGLHA